MTDAEQLSLFVPSTEEMAARQAVIRQRLRELDEAEPMADHRWTVHFMHFSEGRKIAMDLSDLEACSGALRGVNEAGEVVVLIRERMIAIRDDTAVMITQTPEPPEPPVTRGFA